MRSEIIEGFLAQLEDEDRDQYSCLICDQEGNKTYETKDELIFHLSTAHSDQLDEIRMAHMGQAVDQDPDHDETVDNADDQLDKELKQQLKNHDVLSLELIDDLKDVARGFIKKADLVGVEKTAWITGFMHGIEGLATIKDVKYADDPEISMSPLIDALEDRDLDSKPHHRTARATILILELFSDRKTIEDDDYSMMATKKRHIMYYLDQNMENPPSDSTITRIIQELEQMGYIQRRYTNTDNWYPSKLVKQLKHINLERSDIDPRY